MALLLARTQIISTPSHHLSLLRVQRSSISSSQLAPTWKPVHHRSMFQCCALSVGIGEFEGSGDDSSGFMTRELKNSPASDQNGAAQVTSTVNPSDFASEGREERTTRPKPWIALTETKIQKAIFDFRFLTLMAIGGSLVGSLLCFLKGCGFICDSYIAYLGMCLSGLHTGKVILRLVEAVEVYLVGTVMLIFGMGLFGLFISSNSHDAQYDRALQNTNLFGMFSLTTRPRWMQITSLDTLKTKLGHCIVMIFTVKLFEKSKTVRIVSSVDLLLYSVAIFLSAASLYVLQQLHASQTPSKN
ncbi:uncharacterized protein [Physcomitrium patens]|uniref:Transmembrane protein n=1 Tax=Physcomitrium patens TaxID=3218 RepID=A0A2K1IR93_PHYPA|nr:uncharacterized protein LOC112274337 [Physcomitrium patens]PNR31795.1 hypothetical protein PHYPA_025918 [Physcomitrium patens]|eukprot:XP_024359522.1 uncharacterized protein LOC112274337 [Physcomitrella patens]